MFFKQLINYSLSVINNCFFAKSLNPAIYHAFLILYIYVINNEIVKLYAHLIKISEFNMDKKILFLINS